MYVYNIDWKDKSPCQLVILCSGFFIFLDLIFVILIGKINYIVS